jgi:hypothetical protein
VIVKRDGGNEGNERKRERERERGGFVFSVES